MYDIKNWLKLKGVWPRFHEMEQPIIVSVDGANVNIIE